MSQPYDASTKYLIQARLADWLPLSGRRTTARLEIIDADLSTVTAAADRVLRVLDDPPWLLHLELQAQRDPTLVSRLRLYNTLLDHRHGLLVHSMVVLLHSRADAPDLSGLGQRAFPGEPPYATWRYQVVRVWQLPPEMFLNGGMGIVPLAPLSAVTESALPVVIQRMETRFGQEASAEEVGTLWTATDILMGLRYPRGFVDQLLRGVHSMKESVTYQGILEDGAIAGIQKLLLQQGRKRFGAPSEETEMAIRSITDLDRLERLGQRLLDVSSWQELLATP